MACAHAGSARTPATGGPWVETNAMALERSWTTPWQRWPRRPEGLSARRGRTWQPSAERLVLPGPRRGRPRRRGPRRRRTEDVARGPGPPCPPGLPTRQAGCCGEARRTRRHAQVALGRGATRAARPPSGTTSPATGTSCRPGAGPQPCRRAAAVAGLVPGPARPIRWTGGSPTPGTGWAEPAASRALRRHAATAARRTSASSRTHARRTCPSVWRAPSCRWACRNGCRPTTRGPS